VRGWLNRILANALWSRVRARAAREPLCGGLEALAALPDRTASPELAAQSADERRRLHLAVERLPPAERAAVEGRYFHERDARSLAAEFGCSAATVCRLAQAGRQRLGRLLCRPLAL
jgi:RNA polymerase sigma factor (sigma-70 family)